MGADERRFEELKMGGLFLKFLAGGRCIDNFHRLAAICELAVGSPHVPNEATLKSISRKHTSQVPADRRLWHLWIVSFHQPTHQPRRPPKWSARPVRCPLSSGRPGRLPEQARFHTRNGWDMHEGAFAVSDCRGPWTRIVGARRSASP